MIGQTSVAKIVKGFTTTVAKLEAHAAHQRKVVEAKLAEAENVEAARSAAETEAINADRVAAKIRTLLEDN